MVLTSLPYLDRFLLLVFFWLLINWAARGFIPTEFFSILKQCLWAVIGWGVGGVIRNDNEEEGDKYEIHEWNTI